MDKKINEMSAQERAELSRRIEREDGTWDKLLDEANVKLPSLSKEAEFQGAAQAGLEDVINNVLESEIEKAEADIQKAKRLNP